MKRLGCLFFILTCCVCFSWPARARTFRVTLIGDTLITGLGVSNEETFAFQLQEALQDDGFNVEIKNASVALETTPEALKHFGQDAAEMPDVMIIALGMMDAVKGIPWENTESNLSRMLSVAEKNEVKVLLVGVKVPALQGEDYPEKMQEMYASLAKKYKLILFPDFTKHIINYTTGEQSSYLLGKDEMHPNGLGIAVQVEGILPYLKEIFKSLDLKYEAGENFEEEV